MGVRGGEGAAAGRKRAVSGSDREGVSPPPPPSPCVSGKFYDFWRRDVRNTRWGLHDVGVGKNEEI